MVSHMWALVRRSAEPIPEIVFRIARSPQELWQAVVEEETLGSTQTRERLQRAGWRAEPVTLLIGDA